MVRIIPSGDSAFIIKVGDDISEMQNRLVRKLLIKIEQENIASLLDLIPSYNELMLCYDPSVINHRKLLDILHSLEGDSENFKLPGSIQIFVPVLYGGEAGPDLQEVAVFNKLTEQEVIQIHCTGDYLVYMLGFTPGFCYLGGMDERIATPRKQSPRLKIPAGSVGIADKQTGIYPVESPGGWQVIGQTPLKLFDQVRNPVFLFNPGDHVKFSPVGIDEYNQIQSEIDKGIFILKKLTIP